MPNARLKTLRCILRHQCLHQCLFGAGILIWWGMSFGWSVASIWSWTDAQVFRSDKVGFRGLTTVRKVVHTYPKKVFTFLDEFRMPQLQSLAKWNFLWVWQTSKKWSTFFRFRGLTRLGFEVWQMSIWRSDKGRFQDPFTPAPTLI